MKKHLRLMLASLIAVFMISSCGSKQPPSKRGQLLTIEQIRSLEKDKTWNGKLVEVEGYVVCKSPIVTVRKKNEVEINMSPDGNGEKLVDANIMFGGHSSMVERNSITAAEKFDNESLKIITDDYQELPNGKFKFTGTLIYDGALFYLDNVVINK